MFTIENGTKLKLVPKEYTGFITNEAGTKYYYKNGKLHRLGKPALCTTGFKAWYYNDLLHRTDGPARE
jgi:protoporphyrinogen oxidase